MTKNQHYVWRGYLKRWTKNLNTEGKIYVFRKSPRGTQPEFQQSSLTKVASSNYYYDMSGFSDDDVKRLFEFVNYINDVKGIRFDPDSNQIEDARVRRDYFEDIMCDYEHIELEGGFIEKIINGDLSFFQDTPLQSAIDLLKETLLNDIPGMSVNIDEVIKELDALKKQGMSEKQQGVYIKHDFLRYFFAQFYRAPGIYGHMKETIEDVSDEKDYYSDLHVDFFGTSLMNVAIERTAANVATRLHTWLERIENDTEAPFITSDNPIVNLTGDEIEEKHEFFYPLSPTVGVKLCGALKYSKNRRKVNKSYKINNPDEIWKLNMAVARDAENEIFGDRESVLHDVKKRLYKIVPKES